MDWPSSFSGLRLCACAEWMHCRPVQVASRGGDATNLILLSPIYLSCPSCLLNLVSIFSCLHGIHQLVSLCGEASIVGTFCASCTEVSKGANMLSLISTNTTTVALPPLPPLPLPPPPPQPPPQPPLPLPPRPRRRRFRVSRRRQSAWRQYPPLLWPNPAAASAGSSAWHPPLRDRTAHSAAVTSRPPALGCSPRP